MYQVFELEGLVWVNTEETYASVDDAIDDHGEDNVRPVAAGLVYSLHEDERGDQSVFRLMVRKPKKKGRVFQ